MVVVQFTQSDVLKLHQQLQLLAEEWAHLEPIQRKRKLHTLKGTANTFGLAVIGERLHAAEEMTNIADYNLTLQSIVNEVLAQVKRFPKEESDDFFTWWEVLQQAYALEQTNPSKFSQRIKDIAEEKIAEVIGNQPSLYDVVYTKWEQRWIKTGLETLKHFPQKDATLNVQIHNSLNEHLINYEYIDLLFPVIEHLIRNSIVHGIEGAAIREFNGKKAIGEVVINLKITNGFLVISCLDDGKGFYLHESQEITMHSGRGVGISAVKEAVSQLGGTVSIHSGKGNKGTEIVLKTPIPFIRYEKALLWEDKDNLYAAPLNQVSGLDYLNNLIIILKSKNNNQEFVEATRIIGCFYIKHETYSISDYAYFNFSGSIGRLYKKPQKIAVQKSIFIVEDAPEQRVVITRFMKNMYPHCEVVEFDDGLPALDAIKEGVVPNLILCDWEMKRKDGDELLHELNELGFNIPFVMVSSREIDRFKKQIVGQGALDLLGKPFDAQKLKLIADPILGD